MIDERKKGNRESNEKILKELYPHIYGEFVRVCLKCERKFVQENKFIRVCKLCKSNDDWKTLNY